MGADCYRHQTVVAVAFPLQTGVIRMAARLSRSKGVPEGWLNGLKRRNLNVAFKSARETRLHRRNLADCRNLVEVMRQVGEGKLRVCKTPLLTCQFSLYLSIQAFLQSRAGPIA
jgi:hypothetical protein